MLVSAWAVACLEAPQLKLWQWRLFGCPLVPSTAHLPLAVCLLHRACRLPTYLPHATCHLPTFCPPQKYKGKRDSEALQLGKELTDITIDLSVPREAAAALPQTYVSPRFCGVM